MVPKQFCDETSFLTATNLPIDAARFFDGKLGLGRLRSIFSKPLVLLKTKGLRGGVSADIDVRLDLRAAEGDTVIFNEDIPAGSKAGLFRLLQNAEDPFAGILDGVADKLSPIDAHKGRCTKTALYDVISHGKAGCFILRALWSEVREAGGSTKIEGPLACVSEVAFFDDDVTRATLELDASAGAKSFFTNESAVGDQCVMAAYEVDSLATPASDGAIANGRLVESGALDGIVIASGANVTDLYMLDGDACDGMRQITTVIEIEAVLALPANVQVSYSARIGNLSCHL